MGEINRNRNHWLGELVDQYIGAHIQNMSVFNPPWRILAALWPKITHEETLKLRLLLSTLNWQTMKHIL